jgi:glycosyltransferase involved in cell wall biosynthesis
MNRDVVRSGSRTFLVDLRVAQYNGDRGIPAYCQSIIRQICIDHPGERYLFLWDDRSARPAWAEEFERYGDWVLEEDVDRGQRGRIDVLLTACFFVALHGRGSDYLYPGWLRLHQPHRLGIVYDLIPYLYPERYLSKDEARLPYLDAFRLMRRYDRLFAISQATRQDTIRLAGVAPERIVCVYGDIDHRKRSLIENGGPAEAGVVERYGLRGPYCVYIGGDDWRKNMDGMVHAFALFHARHRDRQLAIVCKLSPERIARFQMLAASLGVRPGAIVFTGYVSDEDLVAITRQAEMMAYPSLYEGLGLPVLEAYGCGIPVVGSNTSSIKELVIPELACDPQQPTAIAGAMERLIQAPHLRAASLAYGRQLLAGLGWRPAAAKVMAELQPPPPTPARGEVAVVGVLPPAQTAIAPYTLAYLQSRSWRTDFFEANPGPRFVSGHELLPGNRVLPAEVLAPALTRGRHDTVIFVLGNSAHHIKVLQAAIRTRLGCRQRRLAYLHEANLAILLRAYLGTRFHDLTPSPWPVHDAAPWIRQVLEAAPEIGGGLRFLAETAAFDGLIVNSHACRDLIRAALGPLADRWTIDVAFLPVEAGPFAAGSPGAPDLHVGTFGTGGDSKRLDLVAESLRLLERTRPVRLTVAGWAAARHCRVAGIAALPFVEVHDAIDDGRLTDLMRTVDVAVQLRSPTHGESSGAVARLLGLGRQVVVTGEGSFTELPPALVTCVPADCQPVQLAAAIEAAAARRPDAGAMDEALTPFGPLAFEARMAEVLGLGSRATSTRPAKLSA